jgi:hypothetical protein
VWKVRKIVYDNDPKDIHVQVAQKDWIKRTEEKKERKA